MSLFSTTVLALSLSADAFAASVGKGVSLKNPKIRDAARMGLIFGATETIAPLVGWLAGLAASSFITSVDHWIAFGLLALVGGKMIWESLQKDQEEPPAQHKVGSLILTAIGTSIDSMAVGATMAFLDINIWLSALSIGTATFLMSTTGIMTGHYIGTKAGKTAEALGGTTLILIGTKILFDHLG